MEINSEKAEALVKRICNLSFSNINFMNKNNQLTFFSYLGILSFFFCSTVFSYAQPDPDTIWSKTLGGSANEPIGFGVGFSGAPAVAGAVLPNGDVYAGLTTVSTDGDIHTSYGSEDVWVVKLNSQGDTLWTKSIGGSDFDRLYELKATNDGGCVLVGKTASSNNDFLGNNGSTDGFLAKLDANGNLVFANLYGGSLVDEFFNVLVLDDGYLVLGTTGSIDGDVPAGNPGSIEAWVMRLDLSGGIIWSRKTSGNTANIDWNELFYDAVPHTNGYILAGLTGNFNNFNTDDILIIKYDSLGNKLWTKEIGSTSSDVFAAMDIENDTSIFIMGRVGQATGDVSSYNGGVGDVWLVNIDSSANIRWEQTYGGSDYDYAYGLSLDPKGDVLISGLTRSVDGNLPDTSYGNFDFWLMEVSPMGDSLASWRWGGSSSDYLHDVAFVDGDTNQIVLFGRSQSNDFWVPGNQGGNDLYVAKAYYKGVAPVTAVYVPTPLVDQLKIYPNPNSGSFQLDLEGKEIEYIEIYNNLGQLVYTEHHLPNDQIQMNLRLPLGHYYIKAKTKEGNLLSSTLVIKN
jgi:hypothetical protein